VEERRHTGMYRNMGIRRLWIIGIRGLLEGAEGRETVNGGIYFICNKEEEWGHIVR